jgi:hypothetical protein
MPAKPPPCPYVGTCRQIVDHFHTEDGGVQRTYAPVASRPGVEVHSRVEGNGWQRTDDWRPMPGMWVKVWAAVVDVVEEGHRVHPEDLLVEVLCHNATNRVPVRRDHVLPSDDSVPPSATRCSSLYETDEGTLVHCESYRPAGHQHRTESPGFLWDDAQAYGHVEVR